MAKSVPKAGAAGGSSDEKAQHSTVRETPSAKGRDASPSKSSRRASAAAREAQEKKKRRKTAIVEVMLADLSKDRRREDD